MLQVGVLLLSIFNGNFSTEWAVRLPFNNVATIPDEASASAISLCERIVAKINEIKKSHSYITQSVQKLNPFKFYHLQLF